MYSKVLSSLTGAWISSCLCAPSRALGPAWAGIRAASPLIPRLVRRVTGAPVPFRRSPPHHKQQENPRNYYHLVLVAYLSSLPFHRPSGAGWKVPWSVGTHSTDTLSKIGPFTTLLQKPGVLRGETPKCVFGDFLHKQKVTPRSVATPLPAGTAEPCIQPRQKGRARGHELSPGTVRLAPLPECPCQS